jgi:hypothetical protein
LAPRDAQTSELKADEHGGFNGAHQTATFGTYSVDVDIPKEKCMLFTFQKEKHWLYGESILKTAYYHYDKKHKLYYISHKKAELETIGLKILKVDQTKTSAERTAAEEVVDTIGVNTRITLPPGVSLDIERGSGGYDPLPLIEHHNAMMARSALTQAVDQVKYAYPYGKGTAASQYLAMSIESIMDQMESTLNSYAIAPLIDWNFGTKSYPTIEFERLADVSRTFLREVFDRIMRYGNTTLPDGFVEEVIGETAKELQLQWAFGKKEKLGIKTETTTGADKKNTKTPFQAFEEGKRNRSDKLKIKAPRTPGELKQKLLRIKNDPNQITGCYELGEKFANLWQKKTQK